MGIENEWKVEYETVEEDREITSDTQSHLAVPLIHVLVLEP